MRMYVHVYICVCGGVGQEKSQVPQKHKIVLQHLRIYSSDTVMVCFRVRLQDLPHDRNPGVFI